MKILFSALSVILLLACETSTRTKVASQEASNIVGTVAAIASGQTTTGRGVDRRHQIHVAGSLVL